MEASKDVTFSVSSLATPEQEGLSTIATTKTYWHQVIVKDFQWLRKGIASPNFQIEVHEAQSSGSIREIGSIEDSSEIPASTEDAVLDRNLIPEELEGGNSSDSEDEL